MGAQGAAAASASTRSALPSQRTVRGIEPLNEVFELGLETGKGRRDPRHTRVIGHASRASHGGAADAKGFLLFELEGL